MLRKRLAKSHDEFLWDLMDSYSKRCGGGMYRMEDLADWIIENNLLPDNSRMTRKRLLTKKLKRAARRWQGTDRQGRKHVRKMIAAKYERIDKNRNRIIDVVWDYLHTTSNHHALVAFSQCDELIEKQRLAATHNVHSFIDNNPNAKGCESQFLQFAFMLEEPIPVSVEKVGETAVGQTEARGIGATEALSKKKPR